jgi:2-polyprenyl-3-methyl-5-hydroxy-6-metoxy-1,4-benzoquinol methylase
MSSQPSDPTFGSYTAQQAAAYAAGRGSYAGALYDIIVHHHRSTGGQTTGVLLDVGTGTGSVARDLAPHFDEAMGADHGEQMIATAKKLSDDQNALTKSGKEIQWIVCPAEDIGKLQSLEGRVDLISVGMAVRVLIAKLGPICR